VSGTTGTRAALLDDVRAADDRLIELCTELVRCPSENPPGDTRAVAGRVIDLLRPFGVDARLHAGQPPMPNVVAVSRGRGPGRRLVFNGHLDTFPAGEGWSVDPFGGVVRDGRVYGRGVSDMKAGLAASMLALTVLDRHRDAWDGELVLAFASDEETMGEWGTAYLLKHVPEATGDAMICGDCGSPDIIRFGEKGLAWLRITAHGRAAHGAHVHLGENALERLVDALGRLTALRGLAVPVPIPPGIEAAMQRAREVSEKLSGDGESSVLRTVTVNLGTAAAGLKVNLVPDVARAEVDVRIPFGLTTDIVITEARRLLDPVPGVGLEVMRRFEPTATDPAHEIVRRLADNAAVVLGRRPVANMRVGASDARLYRAAGVPAAVYGPTPHGMGGPDEHVRLDELRAIARIYVLTAFDFLSPSPQ
jgi:succinyl-diaminopimelate desuccinylase